MTTIYAGLDIAKLNLQLHLAAFTVRFKQVALPAGDVLQKGRPADFVPRHELAALQVRHRDGGPGGARGSRGNL
jgi:hypothetical protein